MTVLEALAILEAATVECTKRNINTPKVRAALDLLTPYIQPPWLIPQFRQELDVRGDNIFDPEGEQNVLRPTFEGIRNSVRDLLGKRLSALALQFAETHEAKIKEEIECLRVNYAKLKEPWIFVDRGCKEKGSGQPAMNRSKPGRYG
jgi:hypothetical protein